MRPRPQRSLILPAALVALALLAGSRPAGAEALAAPRLARSLRLSGEVVVEALVDSAGVVRATNVVRSQPVLDDSACAAVLGRRFAPARDSTGRAIASVRTVPLRFESPRLADEPFARFVDDRCAATRFALELDPRPDSAGALVARWTAQGSKAYELRLVVLTPDGVDVDTTGSTVPQRLLDGVATPGWPAWARRGKELKPGTSGTVTLRLPAAPWWTQARIAFVALFHDILEREWVVRQAVYRIERDAAGPLLVRDGRVPACLAAPGRSLGPVLPESVNPAFTFPPAGDGGPRDDAPR